MLLGTLETKNHWLDSLGNVYEYNGLRSKLVSHNSVDPGGLLVPEFLFLLPGENREFMVDVLAPSIAGCYVLRVTAIQEGVFWFDDLSNGNALDIFVAVSNNKYISPFN